MKRSFIKQLSTYLEHLQNSSYLEEEYYYGFEILDGKLKKNIDLLFLGINPGSGNDTKHYKIISETNRISYLDYFDYEYNYPLANETIKIFKIIGLNDIEIQNLFAENSVKSNIFSIITKAERDIKKSFKSVLYYKEFEKRSFEFIGNLINFTKPKFIICEGKKVYDILYSFYEKEEILFDNYENNVGIIELINNKQIIIGYSRNRSIILNKIGTSNLLKSKNFC